MNMRRKMIIMSLYSAGVPIRSATGPANKKIIADRAIITNSVNRVPCPYTLLAPSGSPFPNRIPAMVEIPMAKNPPSASIRYSMGIISSTQARPSVPSPFPMIIPSHSTMMHCAIIPTNVRKLYFVNNGRIGFVPSSRPSCSSC